MGHSPIKLKREENLSTSTALGDWKEKARNGSIDLRFRIR